MWAVGTTRSMPFISIACLGASSNDCAGNLRASKTGRIDNIYCFIQAGMEVSALLGRLSSEMGYQATLDSEIDSLQERIASTSSGSLTSIQAVYIPADDLTDPSVASTFSHLDATTVLSRRLASASVYPSIDPLQSTSILLNPIS